MAVSVFRGHKITDKSRGRHQACLHVNMRAVMFVKLVTFVCTVLPDVSFVAHVFTDEYCPLVLHHYTNVCLSARNVLVCLHFPSLSLSSPHHQPSSLLPLPLSPALISRPHLQPSSPLPLPLSPALIISPHHRCPSLSLQPSSPVLIISPHHRCPSLSHLPSSPALITTAPPSLSSPPLPPKTRIWGHRNNVGLLSPRQERIRSNPIEMVTKYLVCCIVKLASSRGEMKRYNSQAERDPGEEYGTPFNTFCPCALPQTSNDAKVDRE